MTLYTDQEISRPPYNIVKIHPLVVFTMSDGYMRRVAVHEGGLNKRGPYAVGLIFGELNGREVIVRDSSCVPMEETEHRISTIISSLIEVHKSQYPNEVFLGWFSFSEEFIHLDNLVPEQGSALYVWARPHSPPAINVFNMTKAVGGQLISTPLDYEISATVEEQLCLSRIADTGSQGSLQAAFHEFTELLDNLQKLCRKQVKAKTISSQVGRELLRGLWKTNISKENVETTKEVVSEISKFVGVIEKTDEAVRRAQETFAVAIAEDL